MTEYKVNSIEIYALLYELMVDLSKLPYDQYPDVSYELLRLCEIFKPTLSVHYLAMRKNYLKWQQNDADEIITKLKSKFASQIKEYKGGNYKVLGFLIGQLVKEGCDPMEAKKAWLKELE